MGDDRQRRARRLTELLAEELFEAIPFNLAVIDRDFNIVHANLSFEHQFGDWRGRKCYMVYKRLDRPCEECPSAQVFADGKAVMTDSVGVDQQGHQAHYIGHVAPLRHSSEEPVEFVLEMTRSLTGTGTGSWQHEYPVLFDRVPCYITVIDRDYRIVRANEAFRDSFGDVVNRHCFEVYKRRTSRCPGCPAARTFADGRIHRSNQLGTGRRGQDIHYAVTTSRLGRSGGPVNHVIEISNDVTAIRKLEHDVVEAERLAAVGQTVAGLAHSIKNILMGLEGGKYIVSLGLQKGDRGMITEGWEMLERNFNKTTTLVKDFLSFSKGRLPTLRMIDPRDPVHEMVDLYKEIAARSGIKLRAELPESIRKAPLDPDGIHTCLTNLVSNAIDACLMGEQKGTEVVVRLEDTAGKLVYEVADNGSGMDYEVKKKIFTTFFTTKGGGGTGLGLLTTRKIVHEHGGRIEVDSNPGKGARFRMAFPRNRLTLLYRETANGRSAAEGKQGDHHG